MYVDAFVSADMKGSGCSMIFCRYTNHYPLGMGEEQVRKVVGGEAFMCGEDK
jgi:hypothetical protein